MAALKLVARLAAVAIAAAICVAAAPRLLYAPYRCDVEITPIFTRTTRADESVSQYETIELARENIEVLRRGIEHCPTNTNLYLLLAANEQLMGRYDDAEQTYRRALTFDQRPEIHQALGDVLVVLGRQDEAVEAYVTAIMFRPQTIVNIASKPLRRIVIARVTAAGVKIPPIPGL